MDTAKRDGICNGKVKVVVASMMTKLVFAVGCIAFSLLAVTTEAWVPSSSPHYGGRKARVASLRSSTISAQQDGAVEQNKDHGEKVSAADAPSSSSSSWVEIGRALELFGITWNDFLSPLGQGLLSPDNENPSDWDEFWELSLKPTQQQQRTTATTTTEGTATTTTTTTNLNNSTADTVMVAEQFTRFLERLGPTYAKFGQALSSRPDIIPRSLAIALTRLQDDIEVAEKFDLGLNSAKGAREILRQEYATANAVNADKISAMFKDANEIELFLASLSENPVAAASIGVVYSAVLPPSHACGGQKVAIKIQRPYAQDIVRKDARLLRRAAELVEAIPSFRTAQSGDEISATAANGNDRFVRTNVTGAVDEFMERLGEELDYRREADNLELFGKLYSHRRPAPKGARALSLPKGEYRPDIDDKVFDTNNIRVVVPEVYKNLCTDRVLVMEWIDGIKLMDLQQEQRRLEDGDGSGNGEDFEATRKDTLELIRQGIDCTLSQLLETGILHADPHGGNLLKVADNDNGDDSSSYRLGYIDFGLLSTIPTTVQDGLICAICQLVFAKNVTAVGELFGELQLLPEEVLTNPVESQALADELTLAISQVLVFPSNGIPTLRFDKLLDVLVRLVPRFRFQLPPYFLNNARALGTLEGMAREADPNFNILRHLYPYAISRLFSNPTGSPVVEKTLKSLIETPTTGRLDIGKLRSLLKDASAYSGYSKRKVLSDIVRSKSGPKLIRRLVREQSLSRGAVDTLLVDRRRQKQKNYRKSTRQGRRRRLLNKVSNYLRL